MLQRHIDVLRQPRMLSNGIQQFLRYAIRIRIQKSHPQQFFDLREFRQQLRQTIAQAQVFAVGSRILSDQRDFPRACRSQIFRFPHDRREPPAAKFSS